MGQLRIAQVIPQGVHPYSGLLVAACRLAGELARLGHAVELWQLGELEGEAEEVLRSATDAGAERIQLSAVGLLRAGTALPVELAARRVEIAQLHGVFNIRNVHLARLLRVPYIVSPHGGYAAGSIRYGRARKEVFRRLFELPMLRRARAITALTEQETREIARFGYAGSVPVLPNGVDPPPAGLDPRRVREELGLQPEERLAVYVGRIDMRAKRLDALLHGIAGAPGWHLALVGGDFRGGMAALRSLTEALGVRDRVYLLGPRRGEALQEVLAAADLFLLLSRSEGLPMALLEAAACGVPAVVSPEVEQPVGIVAAGGGWEVVPERLAGLLRSAQGGQAQELPQKGAAARAFARRFEWSVVAEAYARLYASVVDAGPTTRTRSHPGGTRLRS